MEFLIRELKELEKNGLFRQLNRIVDSSSDTWITIEDRRVLNLCSNNYLGLANDIRLKDAAIEAIKKYGVGSGASRLVSGDNLLHHKLEENLAKFKNTEKCIVFNSGYAANLGLISSLVSRQDIVFCDKLNHASIIDGAILSRAELRRYPHNDITTLNRLIKKFQDYKKKLIVTDSVFSMDGDIAPLEELIELAQKYNCMLMLDEAHATGVLGSKGRGALEFLGLEKRLENKNNFIIQMGTLSKAFGSFGAYVCGSKDLIDYLINHSRPFIYSTSLPPAISAASIKALEIVENGSALRQQLMDNVSFFKKRLLSLGFNLGCSQTQIIPLITKDPILTMEFSKRLFEDGIFVQGIRPPTVPVGQARLRITIMATHRQQDLEFALQRFEKIGRELCLI